MSYFEKTGYIFPIDDDIGILIEKYHLEELDKDTTSICRLYLQKMLKEMPSTYNLNPETFENYNDLARNAELYKTMLKNHQNSKIDEYIYKSHSLSIYNYKDQSDYFYILADDETKTIVGLLMYGIEGDYFISKIIWNHWLHYNGVLYDFFINYIMKHYNIILSSVSHTSSAKNFWKHLIEYCTTSNIECGIKQNNIFTKFDNIDKFEDAYKGLNFEKQLYIKVR